MEAVLHVLEAALIIVTIAWVGNRPTVAKVSAVIAATWLVEFGGVVFEANAAGMGPADYYLQELNRSLGTMNGSLSSDQQAVLSSAASTVAGCLPALYAVVSSSYVFAALCARWVFDRARHRTRWTAFSKLDLSYWWVTPLIAGIVIYVVSCVPGVPNQNGVLLVALNVIIVSVIPLFVQGAACGKGIMDRWYLGLGWQLALGFFGILSGVVFAILPVMGLIDFWANFRRLPRDGQSKGPEQRRLPE